MQLLLIKKDKIDTIKLPANIFGSYWIVDRVNSRKNNNLINVFEENGKWKIVSNEETKILESNGTIVETAILTEYSFYYIQTKEKTIYILYSCPVYDKSTIQLSFENISEINIGTENTNEIVYNLQVVGKQNTKLTFKDNTWRIFDLESKFGTYLNGVSVRELS